MAPQQSVESAEMAAADPVDPEEGWRICLNGHRSWAKFFPVAFGRRHGPHSVVARMLGSGGDGSGILDVCCALVILSG